MTTFSDLFRVVRNKVRTTPSSTLDVGAVDRPGSFLNVATAAMATLGVELDNRSAARFAANLTASAREQDLDRLILEQTFGELARKEASAAVYSAYVARAGTLSGEVPAGTRLTAGGLEYTLDAPLIFATNQLGPQLASFTCKTLGTIGNLGPTAITGLKDVGSLFDPTLTVTPYSTGSDGYATGGDERETDASFRARRALFDAGLDRNIDVLAAGALTVPGIVFATPIEEVDAAGYPTGAASLFIADTNGRANPALVARVRARLRAFRLIGQHIGLFGAAPSFVSFTVHVAVLDGFDIGQTQTSIRAAIAGYVNALAPGATLTQAGVATAIATVPGVVFEPTYPYGLVTPAADVAPSSLSTIFRTSVDLVAFG